MVRLFSNFDTKHRQEKYEECCLQYGKSSVVCVRRDSIYLYIYIIFPYLISFLLLIVWLLTLVKTFSWDSSITAKLLYGIVTFCCLIGLLPIVWRTGQRMIDYYLDFVMVTPTQITLYDQSGIFSRSSKSIDSRKLKTVSVDKKWFLRSIFNYGSILFLTEWDSEYGDVKLNYIKDPYAMRKQIREIMHLDALWMTPAATDVAQPTPQPTTPDDTPTDTAPVSTTQAPTVDLPPASAVGMELLDEEPDLSA